MSVTSGLNQKLTHLKLSRMREVVDSLIAQAEQHQLGYAEFLDELLNEEVLGRRRTRFAARSKPPAFPIRRPWSNLTSRCAPNSNAA